MKKDMRFRGKCPGCRRMLETNWVTVDFEDGRPKAEIDILIDPGPAHTTPEQCQATARAEYPQPTAH